MVCTIEKANTLINRMLEEDALHKLSCVVVDELHMVRFKTWVEGLLNHMVLVDSQAFERCSPYRRPER